MRDTAVFFTSPIRSDLVVADDFSVLNRQAQLFIGLYLLCFWAAKA